MTVDSFLATNPKQYRYVTVVFLRSTNAYWGQWHQLSRRFGNCEIEKIICSADYFVSEIICKLYKKK